MSARLSFFATAAISLMSFERTGRVAFGASGAGSKFMFLAGESSMSMGQRDPTTCRARLYFTAGP